jgi:hypothetical protein
MPEYYEEQPQQYYQQPQQQFYPMASAPISEAKPDLMKWLFSFREQVITPLQNKWTGKVLINGQWTPDKTFKPIMNKEAVDWAISYIESFLNPVLLISNLTKEEVNSQMQIIVPTIYNSLYFRYKQYGIQLLDIDRIGIEIESKIYFILKGAEDNGYRIFLKQTHNVSEVKQVSVNDQRNSSSGFFSGGIFGSKNNGGLM